MYYRCRPNEVHCRINWQDDEESGHWDFAVDSKRAAEFPANVREAIKDWLTDNPHEKSYNWNWGDAIVDVEASYWEKYGIRLLDHPSPACEFTVNHGESLAE
jgi:hypothetical protein